jgi:hypothetical protein
VSDHLFRPPGLTGPRPRLWSLTPPCLCLSRLGSSRDACVREAHPRSADPRREQRPSRSDCATRNSRAQGAARRTCSAPPTLRVAAGLDRATRGPVSELLSTAAAEVLDDAERRRYLLIISVGCRLQPPPHRPVWSTFESLVSGHGSFPKFPTHFLVVCSCDLTSANPMIEPDCVSASGQVQIRPCNHVEVVTLPRRYAGQCRCARSCTQCARSQARTTAASTLRMCRRIMAERRRPRTGCGRRHWTHARANDKGRGGASADASLRAFVRALARQAARECFELELKQQSRTTQ